MSHIDLPRRGPGGKLEAFRAGHVFLMPQGATWLNHDKPRPFALATTCTPSRIGTMVYGSTQETERRWSAAHVEVRPNPTGVNANGLRLRTFFFPGVIFPVEHAHLPPHLGFLGPALSELRTALRKALGIGTGSCTRPGAPPRSRRGRIVRLTEDLAIELRTPFGVLVTEHVYSQADRYQLLVPILRGEGLRSLDDGLVARDKEWMSVLARPTATTLFPVHLVQSVWYDDDVAEETPFVLDDETLEALEGRLCAIFGLSPA